MLDLKGARAELGDRVLGVLRPYLGERRFTVCARRWGILEPFVGTSVRRVYSVGSTRQLRELLRRFAGDRLDGVSIHERLLDAPSVAALRSICDVIMTWPVNRPERARELLRLGVDGLITDDARSIGDSDVLGATV